MRRFAITATSGILLLVVSTSAEAQTSTLFLFGDIQQAATLDYTYTGRNTEGAGGSSTQIKQHFFEEGYHLALDYAVLDTRVLRGTARTDIRLNQKLMTGEYRGNGDTSGTAFRYRITGTFMEKRPYTLNFFSSSETSEVQRQYSRSFSQNIDTNGFGLNIKNKTLPFYLSYAKYITETSGLGADRRDEFDRFFANVTHDVGRFSRSELSVKHNGNLLQQINADENNERYSLSEVNLKNTLIWNKGELNRSLGTSVTLGKYSGDREETIANFQEACNMDLGNALELGQSLFVVNNSFGDEFRNDVTGIANLRHKLFSSLNTYLEGKVHRLEFNGGDESEWRVTASPQYRKKLPGRSELMLVFSGAFGHLERNLDETTIPVIGERHNASIVEEIRLHHLPIIPGTIVVRHSNPMERLAPYVEDVDYMIVNEGLQVIIFVIPGGEIPEGTDIVIDYVYYAPIRDYTYIQRRAGISLSLLDNSYRLFAAMEEHDQEAGPNDMDITAPSDYKTVRGGLEYLRAPLSLRVELTQHTSEITSYDLVDVSCQYMKTMGSSVFTAIVRDRWMSNKNEEEEDNTLSIGATYRKQMFRFLQVQGRAEYLTITGKTPRDDLIVAARLVANVGKISTELAPEIHWSRTESVRVLEQEIRFRFMRHF